MLCFVVRYFISVVMISQLLRSFWVTIMLGRARGILQKNIRATFRSVGRAILLESSWYILPLL
jgi:hypothetical protein